MLRWRRDLLAPMGSHQRRHFLQAHRFCPQPGGDRGRDRAEGSRRIGPTHRRQGLRLAERPRGNQLVQICAAWSPLETNGVQRGGNPALDRGQEVSRGLSRQVARVRFRGEAGRIGGSCGCFGGLARAILRRREAALGEHPGFRQPGEWGGGGRGIVRRLGRGRPLRPPARRAGERPRRDGRRIHRNSSSGLEGLGWGRAVIDIQVGGGECR
mmetsp:Transcript_116998/g.335673  ORF Transcript_116998/g.335673 Transcript_116998/m.335673 type:complete len:212 (-) Transcript_116998:898-1533(-)